MVCGPAPPIFAQDIQTLAAKPPRFDEAAATYFESQVRPLLAKRCYECHAQAKELKGGLQLDSRALALKGGETGPAVVPGKPKASLLVDAINYGDIVQMPPKSKLPKDEIAVLTKWIERVHALARFTACWFTGRHGEIRPREPQSIALGLAADSKSSTTVCEERRLAVRRHRSLHPCSLGRQWSRAGRGR